MKLDFRIVVQLEIPEALDALLEDGDADTFEGISATIQTALALHFGDVKVHIEDCGPHNVGIDWDHPGPEHVIVSQEGE